MSRKIVILTYWFFRKLCILHNAFCNTIRRKGEKTDIINSLKRELSSVKEDYRYSIDKLEKRYFGTLKEKAREIQSLKEEIIKLNTQIKIRNDKS